VFGDIFLEDLKRFRDELLFESGLAGIYPLWKCNSNEIISQFLSAGFKTAICACNRQLLPDQVVGRMLDAELITTFPPGVDVCGENGEFHTFVFDGPIFRKPVAFEFGNVVTREYCYKIKVDSGAEQDLRSEFVFQELL
jgi:diphthamide synthase (EF-2-diphthine--ammonia ligase)